MDDEFIDILKRQDKSVSGVVKDALRVYLKTAERKKGFDQVIESAEMEWLNVKQRLDNSRFRHGAGIDLHEWPGRIKLL